MADQQVVERPKQEEEIIAPGYSFASVTDQIAAVVLTKHTPLFWYATFTAAMGLLQTDMQYEHARSLIVSLKHADQAAVSRINAVIDELVERCRRDLEKDGVKPERQKFQKLAECRYHGQGFELRANLPDGKVTVANLGDVVTG